LRTFAAGQKYVGWRAETRRFCLLVLYKDKEQQIINLLLTFSIIETGLNFLIIKRPGEESPGLLIVTFSL